MRPHFGWRLGTLSASMVFLAMAVRKAPGLAGVETIRFNVGPTPLVVDPYVPAIVAALALSTMGALVRWTRFVIYGFLTSGLCWTLAGASSDPLWLIGQKTEFLIARPGADVVLLGALSVAFLLVHLFIDALKAFRDASLERGVPENLVDWDQKRLAASHIAAIGGVFVVALVLSSLFQGPLDGPDWVPELTGGTWGAWVLVLVAVLLGGVLLVLGFHENEPKKEA